ncbi:O-antigen ligase [Rubricella aquisinus]|uniref:O-antigen ligase n=1 Tax=Rubricella aquisinus TaxID=2028108 RepID=A0A840WNM7_9RHOB|nr:O-antigen ligase family protein [Rubricella aquisinus]MBB5515693.1 O-antigen ligase [Rubricella aquisinus]
MTPDMAPARGLWRVMINIGLGFLVAFPLTTLLSPLSTVLSMVLCAVFLVGGSVGAGLHARHRLGQWRSTSVLFGLGLVGWAVLSLMWSINAAETRAGLIEVLGLIVFAGLFFIAFERIAVETQARFWVGPGLLALLVLSFGLVILDRYTLVLHHLLNISFDGYHRHNSAMMVLTVLIWPMVGLLGERTIAALGLIALGLVASFYTSSMSAQVMMCAGTVVYGLFLITGKSIVRPLMAFCVLVYLGMIWAGPGFESIFARLPESLSVAAITARIDIWTAVLQGLFERPLLGYGFHSSHLIPEVPYVTELGAWAAETSTHPHNLSLALWFEMGIAAFVLGLGLLVSFLKPLQSMAPREGSLWMIAIAAALGHMEVGRYPWISWWQFGLLATVLIGMLILRRGAIRL